MRLTLGLALPGGPVQRVVFEGVTDLVLRELNAALLCVLIADDLHDWQREGANYAVRDAEDEVVSFKCIGWSAPPAPP